MAGEITGQFGEWLTKHLNGQPYQVFYDHGDQQSSANVAKVKGFVGDEVTRQTQIAQIDVMVANRKKKEAVLLIELEESDFTPKRILGDIFAILVCNNLAVLTNHKQNYFKITPETSLIVAGSPPKGSKTAQIEEIIKSRLGQFTTPIDSVQLQNVRIICNNAPVSTVSELKEIVKAEFGD
jgi:hypothetical protein